MEIFTITLFTMDFKHLYMCSWGILGVCKVNEFIGNNSKISKAQKT